MEHISTVPLVDLLSRDVPVVRTVTAQGLAADTRLAETSVLVIAVRIVSIRPQPDLEKALETPVREPVQQRADAASYERRAVAVERERTIAENELRSKIELATGAAPRAAGGRERPAPGDGGGGGGGGGDRAHRVRVGRRTEAEAARTRQLGAAHADAKRSARWRE